MVSGLTVRHSSGVWISISSSEQTCFKRIRTVVANTEYRVRWFTCLKSSSEHSTTSAERGVFDSSTCSHCCNQGGDVKYFSETSQTIVCLWKFDLIIFAHHILYKNILGNASADYITFFLVRFVYVCATDKKKRTKRIHI